MRCVSGTYEYGTSPLRGKGEKCVENLRKQVWLMAVDEDENIANFCCFYLFFLLNEKCGWQIVSCWSIFNVWLLKDWDSKLERP